jgi:hypothetical protein
MAATSYIVLQHLAVDPDETSDDWRVIGTADVVMQHLTVDPDETAVDAWVEVARAEGATPQAAIKAATNGKPAAERTGTFVAVPARSFKPITRVVETREVDQWT